MKIVDPDLLDKEIMGKPEQVLLFKLGAVLFRLRVL
jgi:hypothetical protein